MTRHHFVPQFMLDRWATNGRVRSFCWNAASPEGVVEGNPTVVSSCQIDDLYAFYGQPRSSRNSPEVEFFAPLVDAPAADVLRVLLADGVRELNPEQCKDWARFLVTMPARMPEVMRSMGPAEFRKAMEIARGQARGPADLEEIVTRLASRNMSSLERNVPLKIAMELASDPTKRRAVEAMEWWTRKFNSNELLLGDRPLLTFPGTEYPCGIPLNDPNCLIVLPISPNRLFFATSNGKTRAKMRRESSSRILQVVNRETIARHVDFVFAFDLRLSEFVRERLRRIGERREALDGGDERSVG